MIELFPKQVPLKVPLDILALHTPLLIAVDCLSCILMIALNVCRPTG